jgi:hypothetical protein
MPELTRNVKIFIGIVILILILILLYKYNKKENFQKCTKQKLRKKYRGKECPIRGQDCGCGLICKRIAGIDGYNKCMDK